MMRHLPVYRSSSFKEARLIFDGAETPKEVTAAHEALENNPDIKTQITEIMKKTQATTGAQKEELKTALGGFNTSVQKLYKETHDAKKGGDFKEEDFKNAFIAKLNEKIGPALEATEDPTNGIKVEHIVGAEKLADLKKDLDPKHQEQLQTMFDKMKGEPQKWQAFSKVLTDLGPGGKKEAFEMLNRISESAKGTEYSEKTKDGRTLNMADIGEKLVTNPLSIDAQEYRLLQKHLKIKNNSKDSRELNELTRRLGMADRANYTGEVAKNAKDAEADFKKNNPNATMGEYYENQMDVHGKIAMNPKVDGKQRLVAGIKAAVAGLSYLKSILKGTSENPYLKDGKPATAKTETKDTGKEAGKSNPTREKVIDAARKRPDCDTLIKYKQVRENDITKLKKELNEPPTDLQNKLDTTKRNVTTLEGEISKKKAEIDATGKEAQGDLKTELEAMEKRLVDTNKEAEDLQKQVTEKKTKIKEAEDDITVIENSDQEMIKERKQLDNSIGAFRKGLETKYTNAAEEPRKTLDPLFAKLKVDQDLSLDVKFDDVDAVKAMKALVQNRLGKDADVSPAALGITSDGSKTVISNQQVFTAKIEEMRKKM